MPDSCKDCRHWSGPAVGHEARRECRASSPAFAREYQRGEMPHPVFLAAWPLTLPSDGCGDFAAQPVPIAAAQPVPIAAAEPVPEPAPKADSKPRPAPKPKV